MNDVISGNTIIHSCFAKLDAGTFNIIDFRIFYRNMVGSINIEPMIKSIFPNVVHFKIDESMVVSGNLYPLTAPVITNRGVLERDVVGSKGVAAIPKICSASTIALSIKNQIIKNNIGCAC